MRTLSIQLWIKVGKEPLKEKKPSHKSAATDSALSGA